MFLLLNLGAILHQLIHTIFLDGPGAIMLVGLILVKKGKCSGSQEQDDFLDMPGMMGLDGLTCSGHLSRIQAVDSSVK